MTNDWESWVTNYVQERQRITNIDCPIVGLYPTGTVRQAYIDGAKNALLWLLNDFSEPSEELVHSVEKHLDNLNKCEEPLKETVFYITGRYK